MEEEEQVSISQTQMDPEPLGRRFRTQPVLRCGGTARSCLGVPWWAMVTAGAAPVLLVLGFLVAEVLQPSSYDPFRDTISTLAARGAADPWVMTDAIAAVGACYLMTAVGLSSARRAGRMALAAGGVATLSIAIFPTPLHGYSRAHALAVIVASTTMCAWPLLAAHRQHRSPLLTFGPNVAASAVTFGLIIWFVSAVNGGEFGLAERCAAVAPALWLFPVAWGARRASLRDAADEDVRADPPAEGFPISASLKRRYESAGGTTPSLVGLAATWRSVDDSNGGPTPNAQEVSG